MIVTLLAVAAPAAERPVVTAVPPPIVLPPLAPRLVAPDPQLLPALRHWQPR